MSRPRPETTETGAQDGNPHQTLADGDLQAKQALLSKVVRKVVMSGSGAELLYMFPL